MGACGCGTDNTSPFSWQWTKLTAAASAPVFGSGTWCGSGCGKCFQLTPTAVGASPIGAGATTTKSVVIKVTNLCPAAGNEAWCAYDVNSYGYDAHFDLMDYNMAGLISGMGWDNPEVTYEQVDCASNGYTDWNCECASATDTTTPTTNTATTSTTTTTTKAPSKTTTTTTTTKAPHQYPNYPDKSATSAPTTVTTSTTSTTTTTKAAAITTTTSLKIQANAGVNAWWYGFSVTGNKVFSKVEIMESSAKTWAAMSYQGDVNWGMYFINSVTAMQTPLSLRFTTSDGKVYTANNIITSFTPGVVDTKLSI